MGLVIVWGLVWDGSRRLPRRRLDVTSLAEFAAGRGRLVVTSLAEFAACLGAVVTSLP